MATQPPATPAESSVSEFEGVDPEAEETQEGEVYSDPDSAGEPAIMLSQAQADAAGMTGAMPGDSFTVRLTVADQNDTGWNVSIDPGSAIKEAGPSMEPEAMPADRAGNSRVMGPEALGMSPTTLNA